MATKPVSCNSCAYWRKFRLDPDSTSMGHCRRYAPRPRAFNPGSVGWPSTHGVDGWCGEHKLRGEA